MRVEQIPVPRPIGHDLAKSVSDEFFLRPGGRSVAYVQPKRRTSRIEGLSHQPAVTYKDEMAGPAGRRRSENGAGRVRQQPSAGGIVKRCHVYAGIRASLPRVQKVLSVRQKRRVPMTDARLDRGESDWLNLKQANRHPVLLFMNQEQRYQALALLALTVVVAMWSVF